MQKLISIMAVMIALSGASSIYGCVCADTTVAESFKDATAIFQGKYLRSEYRQGIKSDFEEMSNESTGKKPDYEVLVYVFETSRWWKGAGTRQVVLITDETRRSDGTTSVSDCGLGFETGREYLVYAYGEGDEFGTNACSLTKRLTRAAKDINALNKLVRPVAAK